MPQKTAELRLLMWICNHEHVNPLSEMNVNKQAENAACKSEFTTPQGG